MNCAEATEVIVNEYEGCNADIYDINLNGATTSSELPRPTCGGFTTSTRVRWVKFTVPSNVNKLSLSISRVLTNPLDISQQAWAMNMAIYRGINCNSLSLIGCYESSVITFPITIATDPVTTVIRNLTPGETIYIRIWERNNRPIGAKLSISRITDPPINDRCQDAIPLTTYGCNYLAGGGDMTPPDDCGWSSTDNSIFYTFEVTSSTPRPVQIVIDNVRCTGGGGNIQLAVYRFDGNCNNIGGNGANYHGCAAGTGRVVLTTTPGNLPNGRYILAVDGESGANCTFGISGTVIQEPPQARFTAPATICAGTCLNFRDDSFGGPTAWEWKFEGATPDTSNLKDPQNICFNRPGTYRITLRVRNNNGSTAISRTIQVTPPLNVSTGPDLQVCSGNDIQLNATVQGGREPYTYNWSPAATLVGANTASPTARPLSNTTYTVQVTDASGCRGTSTVTVRIVSGNLSVQAGRDTTLCQTTQLQLNPRVTGGTGNYFYQWRPTAIIDNPTIARPTATIDRTTTLILTVNDGNCSVSHQFTVTLAPPMSISFTPAGPLCGTPSQRITAIVNGGTGPFRYHWQPTEGLSSPTVNNPIVNPNTPTTYTLTVTDSRECSQNATITVFPTPGAPPTLSIVLCQAGSARFTATMGDPAGTEIRLFTQSTGGAPISIARNFPYELLTPNVTTNTTFFMESAQGNCVSPRSTVIISLQPSINAFASFARCANPTTTINFSVTTLPGASYLWRGPNGFISNLQNPVLSNVNSSASGEYTVQVTAAGCPPLLATTTVTIYNTPSFLLASSNSPVCLGGELRLTGIVTEPNSNFHWQGPAGFQSNQPNPTLSNIQENNAGNYQVYAVANGCTSATSSISVTITRAVSPIVENPHIQQCGPGIVMFAITLPTGYKATLYDGTTRLGQAVVPPHNIYYNAETTNTRLSVIGESPEGCISNAVPLSVTIVPQPGAPFTSTIHRCGIGVTTFTAQMGTPAGRELRLYSTLEAQEPLAISQGPVFEFTTPFLTQTTAFYLESYSSSTCKSQRIPVVINLTLPPTPSVTSPIKRCRAGTVTLSFHGSQILEYQLWDAPNNGNLLATISGNQNSFALPSISQTTTFWLSARNEQRCEGIRIPIEVIIEIPIPPNINSMPICGSGRVIFTISHPQEGKVFIYENLSSSSPVASTEQSNATFITTELERSTSYYFAFRSLSGCESERILASAIVYPIPGLPSITSPTRCGPGFITITAQVGSPPGNQLLLYDAHQNLIGSSSQIPWIFDMIADNQLQLTLRSKNTSTGCISEPLPIQPRIIYKPQTPVLPDVGRCGGGRVIITFTTTEPVGVVINLYETLDSQQPISTASVTAANQGNLRLITPVIQTTTTFYLRAENQGCHGEWVQVPVRIVNLLQVTPIITPDDGSGNGSCRFEVRGGFAPYTFILSDLTQPHALFTNLRAGIYQARILDSQNCVATLRIEIPLVPANCPTPRTPEVSINEEGKLAARWLPVPGASRYELRYRIVGEIQWSQVFTTTEPIFVFMGLQPETEYELQVRAICSTTPSEWVKTNFTTPLCNAVNFIWMSGVTENEGVVNWSIMENATGYEFSYRPQNALFWQPEHILPHTHFLLTDLVRGATYEVKVRTLCLNGSVVADYVYNAFTTLKCDPVEEIAIFHLSETSVQLNWRATPDASAFRISYTPANRDNWQMTVVNESRVVLNDLLPGQSYNVRIQTLCNSVEGQFSQVSFTTRAIVASCPAPQGIQVRNISNTRAELTWFTAPQANAYQLRYRMENGPWFAQTATSPYLLTNLQPGTRYFYQVRSVCSSNNSEWSPEGSFRTISARQEVVDFVPCEPVIYPNPNGGKFAIQLPCNEPAISGLELRVYSLEGKLIKSYSFSEISNTLEFLIELPELPEGFYLVNLHSGKWQTKPIKMIIRH
ncbi:MAG: fibronectin type III domain-containing protein [Bacteroidia bacterium]|nr:fibronectin type III domain-containing protein [Bacteroidia bacterium]MDW8158922.1 fibronectin type III domain-containing protein [Bacteroidia bacterium]